MKDSGKSSAELAELASHVIEALDAPAIVVTLQNSKVVKGSLTSLVLKKKKKKKGAASWGGKLSVETDSGVLEMDCASVTSVKAA